MSISAGGINSIPASFYECCLNAHLNNNCKICTAVCEIQDGLSADMVFSILPWMQKRFILPCVWSLGKFLWASFDDDVRCARANTVQELVKQAMYFGITEERLLDQLMEGTIQQQNHEIDHNNTLREELAAMYKDTLDLDMGQCSLAFFYQPALLYFYTITQFKKPKIIRAFHRLTRKCHADVYNKSIGEEFRPLYSKFGELINSITFWCTPICFALLAQP